MSKLALYSLLTLAATAFAAEIIKVDPMAPICYRSVDWKDITMD